MNCNIIKDLIPLYIDNCCSEESFEEVKKHIETCNECKKVFDGMSNDFTENTTTFEIKDCAKINNWKASILQSVLFLLSFILIVAGVYIEASTGYHDFNGLAAFNVVVPATAFLLSLINWYFVKLYPSRKVFSWCSCVLFLVITFFATVWCSFHYEISLLNIFSFFIIIPGILLTIFMAVFSKVFSGTYARLLGKE